MFVLHVSCFNILYIKSVDVVSNNKKNSINGNNVFQMIKLKVKEMQYTARVILSV